MNSGRQLARILVGKITALQERQDVAPRTWAHLIGAMHEQATPIVQVVRAALEKPPSGPYPDAWVELFPRDAKPEALTRFLVFLGLRQENEEPNPEQAAKVRFYLDQHTCRVVVDRKPFGLPDEDRHYEKLPDLAELEDMTLAAFVEKLLEFLKWASVGEGRRSQRYRFCSPESRA